MGLDKYASYDVAYDEPEYDGLIEKATVQVIRMDDHMSFVSGTGVRLYLGVSLSDFDFGKHIGRLGRAKLVSPVSMYDAFRTSTIAIPDVSISGRESLRSISRDSEILDYTNDHDFSVMLRYFGTFLRAKRIHDEDVVALRVPDAAIIQDARVLVDRSSAFVDYLYHTYDLYNTGVDIFTHDIRRDNLIDTKHPEDMTDEELISWNKLSVVCIQGAGRRYISFNPSLNTGFVWRIVKVKE